MAGTASAGGSNTLLTPSGGGGGASGQQQQQGSSVCKVFDILTRGESGLAQQFEAVMKQEVGAGGQRGMGGEATHDMLRSPALLSLDPACSLACTWSPACLPHPGPAPTHLRHAPQVEAVEHMVEDAGQHNVSLDGLAIRLGPDLRAMYPLVMNFGVEGELTVSGPAHPDQVGGQAGRRRRAG